MMRLRRQTSEAQNNLSSQHTGGQPIGILTNYGPEVEENSAPF
jgi:hypothetical protein